MGVRGDEGAGDGGSEMYSLIFVLMLFIKFQVPSSSGSLVLTETGIPNR